MRLPDVLIDAQGKTKNQYRAEALCEEPAKVSPEEKLWCAVILCWINDLKGYKNRVCSCPEKTYCISCRRLKEAEREAASALIPGSDQHTALLYVCNLIQIDNRSIISTAQQIVANPLTTKVHKSASSH